MKPMRIVLLIALLFAGPAWADTDDLLEELAQARQAYDDGQWEEARQRYGRLAERVPDNTEIGFRLGNALVRLGRLDEAAASYQLVLARQPAYPKGWHNLALVRLNQAMAALASAAAEPLPGDALASRRLLDAIESALSGGKPPTPACPATAAPVPPPAPAPLAAYTAARVNLRTGCGADRPRLDILAADSRVEVLMREEQCAQVRTEDDRTGWLPLSLLRLAPATEKRREP